MNKILRIAALLALTAAADLHAATANYCGELANSYGPYDYRRRAEFQQNVNLVEMAHFTPDVEYGIKGATGTLGGDLDYTLRAIPNHHRALNTLITLAQRERGVQVTGMRYPVECWFNRALRFTPDDANVYAVYGSYLFSLGKTDEAAALFKQGAAVEPENATINYNLGLVSLKQGDFEQARAYAKKAYDAGFPLPGLKNKLAEAGQWEDKAD
ncbi:tetratricopeptide repeat protein [Massilia horti]|uniref:Tetratricopeptide repeat protein n=1 Tax=Massilia horti TaxID=2562153 RepID=A0A4Y9SW16_9BURK|nr:tetratricopeptide repeat protein [Massilia horti]TFW30665.1 tetratricopeptide repeat protein [Massilia horti]